jgi:ABC-type dipeptide/oligopeptide/nickel transport system ATPase component
VNDAPLVLADEPTANLDAASGYQALHLLEQIAWEDGKTVVVVTHDRRIRHAYEAISDHLAYALAGKGELDSARQLAGELPADAITRRLLHLLDGDSQAAAESWAGTVGLHEPPGVGDLLQRSRTPPRSLTPSTTSPA